MKRALVIGRAATVWDEIASALAFGVFDAVIVINRMGRDYPGEFHHWVSYHPDLFAHWAGQRKLPMPPNVMYWSGIHRGKKLGWNKNIKVPLQHANISGGSSGLLAVKVAIEMLGMDRIILAGCPMENTPRYDDRSAWKEANAYWSEWEIAQGAWFGDRVRSLSGRTRKLLGAPTEAWFGPYHQQQVGIANVAEGSPASPA